MSTLKLALVSALVIGSIFLTAADSFGQIKKPRLEVKTDDYVFNFDYDPPDEIPQNRLTNFTISYAGPATEPTMAKIAVKRGDYEMYSFQSMANPVSWQSGFEHVDRYQAIIQIGKTRAIFPFNVGNPDRLYRPWEEPGSFGAFWAGLLGLILGLLVSKSFVRINTSTRF